MLETTVKIPKQLKELNGSLEALTEKPSFKQAQLVVNNVISLLGISASNAWKPFNDSQGKIRSNAGWFMVAEGFADKRAAYKLVDNNSQNIDMKCYWMKKSNKSIISWLVALTPNFEDEPFYGNLNFGIDFIIPEEANRILVVLSKNYIIRSVELQDFLSVTQQNIFNTWLTDFDYSNKAQVHEILWKSFDFEPISKAFYVGIKGKPGIVQFFNELKQFLAEDIKIFDDKHAAFFTNRLIGRIVFCWFLNKKGIINRDIGYFDVSKLTATEYYRQKLETLFFKVFNTPLEDRILKEDQVTPFLNGGLFEVKENDMFGRDDLTFPNDYFDRFYDFLNHYNFTTDESTASFQQVAIDPEMLGRIFENLLAEQVEETGEQARKAKGAFYTPREIVYYMCRESLREYLKTKIPEDDLRDQRIGLLLDVKPHEFRDQQRNYRGDLKPYKYDILKALDEIKIIDPACGSGAFPMGMLHLLLNIYDRLDATFDSYKKKINIIKNNLFGVDIEPMAVEICRLRVWLSIIVDEESDSKKIEPLPNLDFKFICANSLIPLKDENDKHLFDMVNKDELVEIRDKYFNARTLKSKDNLRKKFEKKIDYKGSGNMFSSDREKQLRTYHPFDSENVAQFFDAEFMFGIRVGFDVVIGNPPYVRVDKISKSLKLVYKSIYVTTKGKYDLYYLFYEFGLKLLGERGCLSYISPNKFCAADSALKLRSILLDSNKVEIVSTSMLRVFSGASNYPVIVLVLKNNSCEKMLVREASSMQSLSDSSNKRYEVLKQNIVNLPNKIIPINCNGEEILFVIKLLKNNLSLGEFIDFSEGLRINKSFEEESESDHPIVKQYQFDKWSKIEEGAYISSGNLIKVTSKKSNRYKKMMKEKILLAEDALFITATLDDTNHIPQGGLYFGSCGNNFIMLGILNSKLLSRIYKILFGGMHMGGGYLRYRKKFIEKLPIPAVVMKNNIYVNEIEENVKQIIERRRKSSKAEVMDSENRIDNLVFDLYELTLEERKIILGKDAK